MMLCRHVQKFIIGIMFFESKRNGVLPIEWYDKVFSKTIELIWKF